jgi:hypothetical protein
MRTIAIAFAALVASISAATPALSAACSLKTADVVATSPYFANNMRQVEDVTPGSVSFVHKDDPRIAVVFMMTNQTENVTQISRSEYIDRLEDRLQDFAIGVRTQGRWAEHSVYPYDPVASRITYEQDVTGVGPAMVSKMQIMLTPGCLMTADFVAPNSPNLRSRWVGLHAAVAGIRDSANRYVVPENWLPDRKVPSGTTSFLGGVVSPIGVLLLLYFMMSQMRNLDPPGVTVRIVMGCSAVISAGALVLMRSQFIAGLQERTFADGGLLLGALAVATAVGAFTSQRGTLVALLGILISGIALGVESAFRWTPDYYVTGVLSASFILLGISGFYAWSEASSSARLRRVTEAREQETKRIAAIGRPDAAF